MLAFKPVEDLAAIRVAVATNELPDAIKHIKENLDRAAFTEGYSYHWEGYSDVSQATKDQVCKELEDAGYTFETHIGHGGAERLEIKF